MNGIYCKPDSSILYGVTLFVSAYQLFYKFLRKYWHLWHNFTSDGVIKSDRWTDKQPTHFEKSSALANRIKGLKKRRTDSFLYTFSFGFFVFFAIKTLRGKVRKRKKKQTKQNQINKQKANLKKSSKYAT